MHLKTSVFFSLLWGALTVSISCAKEPVSPAPDPSGSGGYTQYGVPFEQAPETGDIRMYEVNIRALAPNSDLRGVIGRLDDIQALGINVIWLMPIHPIGSINSVNSPYSVQDHKAVNQAFGDLEDLRALTDEAHQRGIAVILDWVANHTAWDHPWIDSAGWHTTNGAGEIIHPAGTNWLDVADLNFSNENMRLAMIDAMKYWLLEANVDGYRCDYADGVPFDFWKQALDSLALIPGRDFIFLAEGARKDHFQAGFQMTYGWSFYGKLKNVFDGQSASGLFATHQTEYINVPEGKHILRFTTNHDESAWDQTPVSLFQGKDGALAASVAAIFMGGAPLIYGSQEVGREAPVPFFSTTAIDWSANPEMLAQYRQLLGYYAQSEVARKGANVHFAHADVIGLQKTWGSEQVLILIHVRQATTDYPVPPALQQTNWTNALSGEAVALTTSIALGPFEYLILEKD